MIVTFDSAFASLQRFWDDTHDHVEVDVTAGRFVVSAPGVTVDDLERLVSETLDVDGAIPDWVPSGLRLVSLELSRTAAAPGFEFSLDVSAADASWSVIDGIDLERAELSLGWGPAGLSGRIDASMHVDGLELDVSVTLPDHVLEAHLRSMDGDSAEVGTQFLERNGFTVPSDNSRSPATSPRLDDLSLYAGLRAERYILHAQVQDLVDAAPFRIDLVEIQAELGARTSVAVWADLSIDLKTLGPVTFDVYAEVEPDRWAFEGRLDTTDDFTLGHLATDILAAFGGTHDVTLPPMIADTVVDHVAVSFDTMTRDQSFECALRWPDDDVAVTVHLDHRNASLTARGTLVVGALRFDLVFDRSDAGGAARTALVGVFSSEGGSVVTLADVISQVGADGSIMGDLATDFSFGLHDAVLAWERSADADDTDVAPTTHLLFAADLDLGVDLSGLGSLPLVGSMLPREEALRLTFRSIVSTAWSTDELEPVQHALPDGVASLPDELDHGARIDARLQLGAGRAIDLPLINVPADDNTSKDTGDAAHSPLSGGTGSVTSSADDAPGDVQWHDVDRSFGPVRLSQVGVHFDRRTKQIELLLSGSISVGGLELTLMGLGARYGLDDQHLDVTLHGIGLDLQRDPIEIGGAFANVDGDFVGKVVIRTEEFAVTALGAFRMISGAPSMFVYGLLDYPLGGPPFFFVEGLAAGFGYNRGFIPPSVTDVRSFPLVTDAAGSTTAPVSIDDQLTRLHHAVPPSLGEYFVAVGVKFSSFKMLESFVLLVVGFGDDVEIDVIGTSTYQTPPIVPPGVPPIARAELNLVGRIVPADGSILIQAQLSNSSYVYNPMCHIFGGFAFASWFSGDHEGDFVLSVGGYHPSFSPPPHYPVPPRIGVAYQISPDVHVKGEGYFALTPSLFMAGVAVEAQAEIGAASASFRMSVDFLIGWEPYHYDARLQVDVSARWHCFHTSAHVDLHIWGPDFAGRAVVSWTVFSFDVAFGHSSSAGPTPIGFDRFRHSFLPDPERACSIRCAAGLVDSLDDVSVTTSGEEFTTTVWVVDPKDLRIETSSVIPEADGADAVGIAPMNRASLTGTGQHITVFHDEQQLAEVAVAEHFLIEPLEAKAFPSALWGTTITRSLHDTPTMAVPGHRITVKDPVRAATPLRRSRHELVAAVPISGHAPDTGWSVAMIPTVDNEHAVRDAHPELPWDRIRHVVSQGGRG